VETQTLLGGINMVDYLPWDGNYTNTIVRNNIIMGGFSTDTEQPGEKDGANTDDVIIKIGIAIGPQTWFGPEYGTNTSNSGTVINNQLSGAFGFGIAMTSAVNFTVENNVLIGNTSFIGARGPNCSSIDTTPTPAPFVIQLNTTEQCTTQTDFQSIPDGNGLTCILPPDGGDFWPFGGNPASSTNSSSGGGSTPSVPSVPNAGQTGASSGSGLSGGAKAGIAIGVILGVLLLAVITWFIRRWAINRAAVSSTGEQPWSREGYVRSKEDVQSPL